jgi:hypothetical protein
LREIADFLRKVDAGSARCAIPDGKDLIQCWDVAGTTAGTGAAELHPECFDRIPQSVKKIFVALCAVCHRAGRLPKAGELFFSWCEFSENVKKNVGL